MGLKILISRITFMIPLFFRERVAFSSFYSKDEVNKKVGEYRERKCIMLILGMFLGFLALTIEPIYGFLTILIFLLMAYRPFIVLEKKVKVRGENLSLQIPGFFNFLKINLECGVNINKSILGYRKFIKGNSYYFNELFKVIEGQSIGGKSSELLNDLGNRVPHQGMLSFLNFYSYYMDSGVESLSYLDELGHVYWEKKKNLLKKRGEEGSIKLVLPMMLIFIAILILVLGPSLFSMWEVMK